MVKIVRIILKILLYFTSWFPQFVYFLFTSV